LALNGKVAIKLIVLGALHCGAYRSTSIFRHPNLNNRFKNSVKRGARPRLTRPFSRGLLGRRNKCHMRILKLKNSSYKGVSLKPRKGSTMQDSKRIALITGANKGIGLEIARQLAQAGVFVIVGARDAGRGEAAISELASQGLEAAFVAIDVNDDASIAAAAETVGAQYGKLDILVNNAGIFDMRNAPPTKASLEAVRSDMNTNFFGALAVTQAMVPLLRKATTGRIINLSSSLGSLSVNSDPSSPFFSQRFIGYNASKAALNMMTIQLAEELRDTGITVNSVSPGYVKTDLTGHNGFMTAEEGARTPVHFALLDDGLVTGRFFEPGGAETPW
jgi:NAD(P)-dependent dehydrogenase (short-subunit alcohol dehydrogenase family)